MNSVLTSDQVGLSQAEICWVVDGPMVPVALAGGGKMPSWV